MVHCYLYYKHKFNSAIYWKQVRLSVCCLSVVSICILIQHLHNSNWHPISYRFGVIAAYCPNFAPTRSLWLKISGRSDRPPPIIFARIVRPMNILQLCPDSFHTCITAETLRAKIEWKSTISHQRGHFDRKFQLEGVAPTNHFCTVS